MASSKSKKKFSLWEILVNEARSKRNVIRFKGEDIEELLKVIDIKLYGQKRRKVKK